MKTERQIAELIFDAFRQTNCRVNHVVMMRTIRFGIEQKLNPIEQDRYVCALLGIINLKYVTYEENPECLRLTEKGYNYIYDDEKVSEMLKTPWLLPLPNNPNWEKAFDNFYNNTLGDDNNKYQLGWGQFFQWINTYNPKKTVSVKEQNEIMKKRGSEKKQDVFELIQSVPEEDSMRLSFYLCAQEYCERKVLE